MGKVILMPGIESISGTMNKGHERIVFQTRKKRDGSSETRMYFRSAESYQRRTKITDKEIAIRQRFALVAERVRCLSPEARQAYADEWKRSNYKFNGKTYNTLRGYIMARMYAQMCNE